MSLSNAQIWIRTTLASPTARRDVLAFLNEAVAQRSRATMLLGPMLVKTRKPYLAHWDGHELIRVELSRRQQRAYGILADGLTKLLEPPHHHHRPPTHRFTLSNVEFDSPDNHNGNRHLAGWCRVKSPERSEEETGGGFAVTAEYFHPDLPHPITSVFPLDRPHYWSIQNRIRFAFPPLFSTLIPAMKGPLVIYVQLCESPEPQPGAHRNYSRVSNVACDTVELC